MLGSHARHAQKVLESRFSFAARGALTRCARAETKRRIRRRWWWDSSGSGGVVAASCCFVAVDAGRKICKQYTKSLKQKKNHFLTGDLDQKKKKSTKLVDEKSIASSLDEIKASASESAHANKGRNEPRKNENEISANPTRDSRAVVR